MSKLKLILGRRATPPDDRPQLTPAARAVVNDVVLPAFSNMWTGTPSSGWTTDQLATDALDFFNKVNALSLTGNHRLRLQNAGDFTHASFPSGMVARGKDFAANGGSLRIEPESGSGPVVGCSTTVQGVTNIEFVNVTLARTVTLSRQASRPARPVAIFRNCRFGDNYNGGTIPLLQKLDGLIINYSDQVQVIDCQMSGVSNCITIRSTRATYMSGNDFQQFLGDVSSWTCGDDPLLDGNATQQKYAADPYCYLWRTGNTARNIIDTPVGSGAEQPHNDFGQWGSPSDTMGYKYLVEYESCYLERFNTWPEGGTQGWYKDDGVTNIIGVEHSFINTINAYNSTGAYGGGPLNSDIYSECNTNVRTAKMEGVLDPDPKAYAFRLTPTGGTTTLHMSKVIVGSIATAIDATIIQVGTVLADPSGGPAEYTATFTGPFTTDGQGRTTYTFDDSGTNTQAQFRAALWSVFQPLSPGAGAPDPATWPV